MLVSFWSHSHFIVWCVKKSHLQLLVCSKCRCWRIILNIYFHLGLLWSKLLKTVAQWCTVRHGLMHCAIFSRCQVVVFFTHALTHDAERMQQLWSLIPRTSSIKQNWFLFYYVENSFSNKITPWSLILGKVSGS